MIRVIQHAFFHLCRSPPQNKYDWAVLCIQSPDGSIDPGQCSGSPCHFPGDLRVSQRDLFQHGARHAGEMLFHTADAGAALPVGDVPHLHAADGHRTGLRLIQAQQELEHSALARTGAGKSTVFKLLLGLYQPEAGTVTIGGVKVGDITDRERRTCIGCVEQHFSRVPGTVLEQITLGDPQITGEMARAAAALAGIDAAIRALNAQDRPIVFILWGRPAQMKKSMLNNPNHLILEAPHPSPLSAYRGFFGSRPFSKTNNFLKEHGVDPIDWQIENV